MSSNTDLPLVIGLIAQNENQALQGASAMLSKGFDNHYRHRIIDLCREDGTNDLLKTLKEDRVAFAYGFAGVGSQLQVSDGVNLWTAARVPFAALWHDHPCYNYRQHLVNSAYVFHCYHVRDHLEARQKHLPASLSGAILLPAPNEIMPVPWDRPMKFRKHAIIFAKTAQSPTDWVKDWQRHPMPLQKVLRTLAELAIQNRNIDLADMAQNLFLENGLTPGDLDLFMGAIQEVDAFIRGWRSDKLVRALLPHPALIVGRGWEYLHTESHRANFIPPVPSPECWSLIWESKIVANCNPLWRDGFHERVWGGLITGAFTLTDRTVKSDALFGNLDTYIGFEWQDDLEDVVASTLRRAEDGDFDYIQTANKVLSESGLTDYTTYIRLIGLEAERIRNQLT